MIWKIDTACLIAAILFEISTLLNLVAFARLRSRSHFDYTAWKALEPDYLQTEWNFRSDHRGWEEALGILNALGWLVLCVPILNVGWILSQRGTTNVPGVIAMGVLVSAGSFSELLSRVLCSGAHHAANWVARSFELSTWGVAVVSSENDNDADSNDNIGWRTLELIQLISHGMLLWVDALEFFFLFGILVLIFFCNGGTFHRHWNYLGLVIALLCFFDVAANVLRFQHWRLFGMVSHAISTFSRMVFFPIWLVWLGRQLPKKNRELVDLETPEAEMT